ncbi:hypothetical protein [Novosphingobium mangrovi (ex Huang et al. 2023)]|uniref:DUF429 domain-containing protein n=1 Tax=Novosphingobium mangrovi (ex Huang et al. 2023) TaxID=2976432 RepID=A0ABT2I2Q7_9SPHN|nr:hypothetical protein [Novosphingobium mangrovi (ex Huang et al. 2023)]MCT2398892.1 hypothetical protein [Novosphingobium mangrovi (ex Huang et al. 2023)]
MAIDWSGAMGERQKGIAVALCNDKGEAPRLLHPHGHARWSRADVLDMLLKRLPEDTLVGLDLGISLPFADAGAFFPGWNESPPDARSLWEMIDTVCARDPHLSATSFVDHDEASTYFRRHGGREGVRFHLPGTTHRRGRMRVTEEAQARAGCKPYSNFNLVGAAQVGKSSLTGMRLLHRLSGQLPVWPIDPLPPSGSVVVEIYTTLAAVAAGRRPGRAKMADHAALNEALDALSSPPVPGSGAIDDHSSDALLTAAWLRTVASRPTLWHPPQLTEELARTEGWTFGAP